MGRGFGLVTPQSRRARKTEKKQRKRKKGNTAAERRPRECGKAAPATPVFIARGRGLVASQPARQPRERGGAELLPGEKGGDGRERGMAWKELKGAGRSDPAVQVLTHLGFRVERRSAASPLSEGQPRRCRRAGLREVARRERRFALSLRPLGTFSGTPRLAPAPWDLGPASRRPRRGALFWAWGGSTRALPGGGVREACGGHLRSFPL